ncbi:MAG: hypothetical protein IKK08_04285 [Clostridia bacterium]|nr:hypothetical protein [Clostridia bacterium]
MQAISLHPQHRLIVSKQIVLFVLVVLVAAFPALSLPLAMLMPLFSCPLIGGKEQWTAYVTAPLPAVLALLHRMPLGYAAGLLLAAVIPVVVTALLGKERTGKPSVFFIYVLIAAFSAAIALLGLNAQGLAVGKGLGSVLADEIVGLVMNHRQRSQLLYQAMAGGLLPIPEGYSKVTLFTLTFDPVFLKELELALHSRVAQLAETQLPALLVSGSMILGLFTGLRVQRMRNAVLLLDRSQPQVVRVALTPRFSMLKIPRGWHVSMGLFLLVYLFSGSAEGVFRIVMELMYHAFVTVYQLQGAALVCALVMKAGSERRVLGGVLAATLYLLLPFALFVLGCFERMFPFRNRTEDDNDETDGNKEEEP